MTFEASSYILFIIRPWGESNGQVQVTSNPQIYLKVHKRCMIGGLGYRWTIVETMQVPQELRDFRLSFLFGLLDSAKHHPFVSLSSIPSSPPKHPTFSDQKKCPTCSILCTGNLLSSTEPDKGGSQSFLWNHYWRHRSLKSGKRRTSSRDWALVYNPHLPWKVSFLLSLTVGNCKIPRPGTLPCLDGHFFLFILSSFSYTALTSMC